MVHLCRIVFILWSIIYLGVSCTVLPGEDVKEVKTFLNINNLCKDTSITYVRSRKIICLICKGFDPTCFGTPPAVTTTSTTSATAPTTTTHGTSRPTNSITTRPPTTRITIPTTTTAAASE